MSDVLSQNEIDSLLAALSTGELDVDEIKEKVKNRSRNMTLPALLNFQKNICVRWKSFLSIMEGFFLQIFRFICARMFK